MRNGLPPLTCTVQDIKIQFQLYHLGHHELMSQLTQNLNSRYGPVVDIEHFLKHPFAQRLGINPVVVEALLKDFA